MCCPSRVRASILHATAAFLVLSMTAACGGTDSEVGATGTTGGNAPFAIEVGPTFITVENRTGAPVIGGEIVISQVGVLPPYRTTFPRLETGASRDFALNAFRGADGTPFSPRLARPRRVTVTAKDITGNAHQVEVPFEQ